MIRTKKLSKADLKRIEQGKAPAESESDFQKKVIALAQLHGWKVAHFRPGMNRRGKWQTAVQGDGTGFPDLLLARCSVVFVAELKADGKDVTPEQAAWLTAFAEADVPAFVWRPSDWGAIEAVLKDGPGEFRIEIEVI